MIIRTHSRTLFAIAYGILQNREEAEDVRVRDPEKFPAWLSMIARHRAHDMSRKRRSLPFTDETIEPSEATAPDTVAMGLSASRKHPCPRPKRIISYDE
jgi:DNA-directed RNA polymerase specialized sigma24 family protein